MAQHARYWTCSKFADWLRGTNKPGAATWEDWETWHDNAKKAHPVRYWLADDCLGFLQDLVTYPTRKLYDVKYYINNRYITKSHALTAHARDIKPGSWCDVGNRFLPCLFNELVNFIEIETAWSHIAWGGKEERKKYEAPWYATGWFRWRTWRCPQAGLDHLDWAMSLTNNEWLEPTDPNYGKPTDQAIKARELKELYLWWTTVYPNRPDPHDASGWSAYCEASRLANGGKLRFGGDNIPELQKMSDKAHKLMRKIEAAYDKEDEQMMIRLIKIRGSLWT